MKPDNKGTNGFSRSNVTFLYARVFAVTVLGQLREDTATNGAEGCPDWSAGGLRKQWKARQSGRAAASLFALRVGPLPLCLALLRVTASQPSSILISWKLDDESSPISY